MAGAPRHRQDGASLHERDPAFQPRYANLMICRMLLWHSVHIVSAGLTLASREKVVVCQDHFISLMTSHASKTHGTLSQQRTAKLLFQLSPLKCISQNVIAVLKEYRAHGTAMMGDIFDELVDF